MQVLYLGRKESSVTNLHCFLIEMREKSRKEVSESVNKC